MKRLLLVGEDRRLGTWNNRGQEGFRVCSKEKLKGAQYNALT